MVVYVEIGRVEEWESRRVGDCLEWEKKESG